MANIYTPKEDEEIFAPFSPIIGYKKMSPSFVDKLNDAMDENLAFGMMEDWSPNLVGKVSQELKFTKELDQIWHPFYFPRVKDVPLWDALSHTDENIRNYLPLYDTSMNDKVDEEDIGSYAWHVDCGKLVTYIKKFLESNCLTFSYIEGEVSTINRWEDGSIRSVVCKHGEEIEGDVFFDCTGFKSILKYHTRSYSRL